MERSIVAETRIIRSSIRRIISDNTSYQVLNELLLHPDRQLCVLLSHNSIITLRGTEDYLIAATLDCPSINAMTMIAFEVAELD